LATFRVPLNASTFGADEVEAAIEVLRSGFVTMGERCLEFEAEFAAHVGSRNAVFVNSGSSANLLAFFALANPELPVSGGRRRMSAGDEVIVPAVTWSTTVWPVLQAGGLPVFVDCDPRTLQMDVTAAKAAISPRTVAICPVHVLGNAVPMDGVLELAAQHGLWVVEDACEALGTLQRNSHAGTLGDIGTYSFYFSHHITTIEGGMLVTDDDQLAELFRVLRAHGWTRQLKNRQAAEDLYPDIDPRFLFVNSGFNVRPTEINAAFGVQQLPKLARFNERRTGIAQAWLADFSALRSGDRLLPMEITPGTDAAWFGFPVRCRDRATRIALRDWLEKKGIETRPVIAGNLARQPAFRHFPHRVAGTLAGADEIMDRGLFWGSHPLLTDGDVGYVSQTVKEFFGA
jgi:CDP-6-deoxy-D-xylo-4-hexulose-3-dehydrase